MLEINGWEEVSNSNMTYLLKTVLAKSEKERAASLGGVAFPNSTEKLKKHITIVCDRISKTGKLS